MNLTNQICWLAGFFEGDGCVGVYKKVRKDDKYRGYKYSPFVEFTNNDPILINEVDRITRKLGVKMLIQETIHKNQNWAKTYHMTTQKYDTCYVLLSNMLPYLKGNKKAIVQLTLRFLTSRELGKTREPYRDIEEKLVKMVRNLTKRGVSKDLVSPETIRYTSNDDNIVRPSAKSEEIGRNDLSPQLED